MADLGKEFLNTIKKSDQKKTSAFDSVGTVTRVKDGVAYVHFAGGVDETPVKLTINAQAGDEVQVRVADGKAWLMGNATRPPTDDAQARRAINLGKQANDAAAKATKDAMVAHEAAESASADAKEAQDAATTAESMATQARTDAGIAKSAANTAVSNLSQVQEVLEVVEWIATHGTYTKATTFNPNATYYTITATQVASPSDDDKDSQGILIYYEESGGVYTRTADTEVDPLKTYYNVSGTPVAGAKAEDIGQYYTLAVSEAMADYIKSHLALTDDGLYIMIDGSKWKVLITDDGVYILDPNNDPVNQMIANGNIVGYKDETHVEIDYHSLQLIAKGEITPYFWVSDLRNKNDDYQAMITETFISYGDTATFTVQLPITAEVSAVDSSDSSNTATRNGQAYTFATIPSEGATVTIVYKTKSPQAKAYTIGQRASGSVGIMSVAEGFATVASGCYSHAEGRRTTANGLISHAEGFATVASGKYSHAEGFATTASDDEAHAEGSHSEALGRYSHAQNFYTVTKYQSQTAIGRFNDNQQDNAFEIGNGTDDNNRSNAFAVGWDGNVKAQGWAGFVQMFAGATAPSGWLFCDGSEVAVADYPLLYAVIGDTYGTPSDSDHFVLPDFMGRTPIGAGQGTGLSNRTRGQKVGAETHKLTVNEMPSHRHKQVDTPWFQSNRVMSSGAYTLADVRTSNVYTEYTGGDQEHNNMQPSLGINFIICTGETS